MRILIIHTAFIGDIVLSTPILRKIKDLYPESKIVYLTTPQGFAILKNNPYVSEVIEYDKRGKHKGILGVLNLGKRLRKNNFNMVISLHRYLRSSLIAWLTRSPIRKCYDNASGAFLFTEKIKYNENKHEVEKILSFLTENPNKKDINYKIELFPGEKEESKIDKILNITKDKKIIAIAPGSKWFTKKWPLEYFNKIIENLGQRTDVVQIIIGGREEELLNIKKTENMIDLRGKTSLLELAQVLKKSNIVITNDSSPIHIASAFEQTHIIAIFGPTVKRFGFFPWSSNSEVLEVEGLSCRPCAIHGGEKCPKGHFKCMLDIKPEVIMKKIDIFFNDNEVKNNV